MKFLLQFGMGWGIKHFAPIISKKIKQFFDHYADGFEERVAGLDNLIESKVGDIFPDDIQKNYDDLVHYAVEFTEGAFTKNANIRFVLNAIMRGKAPLSKDDLKKWSGKGWETFLKEMPKEMKVLISQEKQDFAYNIFSDLWKKIYTKGSVPPAKVLSASIKRVVETKNGNSAKIESHVREESFTELWEALTKESQDRQDGLQ